jgi:glycosyltransferase involved in cell wall biosynthesis
VVELNSVIDTEYIAAGKALRGRLYRFIEARTLDHAVGWFPVTDEIYEYARRASGTKRPFLIAKNGFDTEGIVPRRSPASIRKELGVADSTPVLVMCGFRWPWHGADRAISMLACMKKRAELWLIGSPDNKHKRLVEQAAESQGVASQVRVFPWMSEEGAADLVAAADVGLGALALDRKRMTEAQPLKVAMYLALGIPVLFNHADPRLSMELPFAMSVRSTDPKVLAEHSEYLLDQSQNGSETIRKFAVERLSWRAVAEEAADFLQDLTLQK